MPLTIVASVFDPSSPRCCDTAGVVFGLVKWPSLSLTRALRTRRGAPMGSHPDSSASNYSHVCGGL